MIWSLIIGAVAGAIAGRITKGGGFGLLMNIVVGVVGGWLGGFLFGLIGLSGDSLLAKLAISVVGAIVLLWIVAKIKSKK